MLNDIIHDLFLETKYMSTQVRIIIVSIILLSLCIKSPLLDHILGCFYFPLLIILIGQLYMNYMLDSKETILSRQNLVRIMSKVLLLIYIMYNVSIDLTFESLCILAIYIVIYDYFFSFKHVYGIELMDLFPVLMMCMIIVYITLYCYRN